MSVRMRVKSETDLLFWNARGAFEFIVFCPACGSDHDLSLEDARSLLSGHACTASGRFEAVMVYPTVTRLPKDEVQVFLEQIMRDGPFEDRAPGTHWPTG